MNLTPGTKLGPYEIVSLLGAGGMGEVYQARDTRLGRTVAVKILPKLLARDRERIQRFEREARLLASLNHVNIATLFGFEQFEGTHFLVMELVDGVTLAERIARGPIPVAEALKIAQQIAEALEAAHEKGIIHRDLKPANVKITPDGKVKVLDFGLAKALAVPSAQGDFLSSPTISVGGTYAGMVLGTAPYMSPEQAKGLDADQRTDVFAFGCVLFEMLTGRRSFQGDTVTEAIASVLARDPDMATLPSGIHPRLQEILRRCFEKDQKRRWQAIGDLRVELEAIGADPHGLKVQVTQAARVPLWKFVAPAAITGAVAVAVTAAVFWSFRAAPPAAPVTRFSYTLPKDQSFTRTGRHVVAISPDGANIVYVANNQLYLKSMTDMDAKPIAGTAQDVNNPFFSPDGKWIAFCAVLEGKLKKIAITGGASVTLADIDNPYGAYWAAGDQIYVGQGPKGVVRVSANGGKAETVVTVKPGEFAQSPQLLPDGDHVIFTLAAGGGDERWDKGQIVVQSLTSGQRTVLVNGGSDARYVPTGHVVYALGATMFALPFNVKTLQASGGPVPVLDGITRASVNTTAAFFSFSDNGSLAFIPGGLAGGTPVTLALVNRNGEKTPLNVAPQPYFQPRISPDGRQLAVEVNDGKDANIWVYDLSGTTSMRRLTFAGKNRSPVWTRDGQRIVFNSDREGDSSLFWQRADGSGAAERLTKAEAGVSHRPESWSPDGVLTFLSDNASAASRIWTMSVNGDRKPKPLVEPATKSSFAAQSAFSPDGRWFVYESGESSLGPQVYVQPFPPNGAKYQISTGLSTGALWAPDGRQIIYEDNLGGRVRLVAVDVRTQPSFAVGKPTPLLIEGLVQRGGRPYDIAPDGKQFIVMLPPSETKTGEGLQINVVLNWFQDLKQRVPVK